METTPSPRSVSPAELVQMLRDGDELAIVDVREELIFARSHLLWARCVPLSRIELLIAGLIPRRSTRIVLCDDNDGLAERAAQRLAGFGYTNLMTLRGGVAGWAAAGLNLYSGVNVPSKAFGEFVEHASKTPSISADELAALLRQGADLVVLDSRPFDEYTRMSIPSATNVPGAELVLHARDIAPSPATTVVVNCAGRTRSIIGAQSLINAGVPNRVVALRNGTMGWSLAGLSCDHGQARRPSGFSQGGLAWAQTAANAVADRFGIERIDIETLDRWRSDRTRSLYIFDVRSPSEYEAGHFEGAVSAPGGQLVQATDQYVGTLGARIVLVDEVEVRALMTGSWLRQMGFKDVFVLAARGLQTGRPAKVILGTEPASECAIEATQLAEAQQLGGATIVDLSLSRDYHRGHIPGAWFAIRSRMALALAKITPRGILVLTSEDGILAGLALQETASLTSLPVRYLRGGNKAWQRAGFALTPDEPRLADDPIDVWLKPYERPDAASEAMNEYLTWEVDLLPRIMRDDTIGFVHSEAKADR